MIDRQKLLRRPDKRGGLFEIALLPFTHSVSEILVEPSSFCRRQVLPARQPFCRHEPHQRRRRGEHVLDLAALRPVIRFHELIRPVFHVLNPVRDGRSHRYRRKLLLQRVEIDQFAAQGPAQDSDRIESGQR